MTDPITALRAALAAGPTPGPWAWHRYKTGAQGPYMKASDYLRAGPDAAKKMVLVHEVLYRQEDQSALITDADAAYIVAACNAAPALLARIEALEGALAGMLHVADREHWTNGPEVGDYSPMSDGRGRLVRAARALLAAHPTDEVPHE